MPKVRILSDRVANQIAAGEVIERPAAVIKELVENSLDAGARRIEVEFRAGGRALMRVEDDGGGMARDDALLALERHATSKIAEADDLNRLSSYGFRGEALPSIASVSKFTLQTRAADEDVGTQVVINGGRFVDVRDCGRPVGTSIEVAQLFNSVPARRKFLKSDHTEAAHIVQCVRLYALARSDVSFTLIEDGRVVFRSPECESFEQRVAEIFGRQIAELLVPIAFNEAGFQLHGLIGKPGAGRATRHEMITFVNARPVDSRTLNYALIESYQEWLPKGRYPLAFVFFDLDPAAVDVNVHPAKREVRFRSEPAVRGFVIRSVLQRLRELGTPSVLARTPDTVPFARPGSGPGEGMAHPSLPPEPPRAALSAPLSLEPRTAPVAADPYRHAEGRGTLAANGGTISGIQPVLTPPANPPVAGRPVPAPPPASGEAPPLRPTAPGWRYVGLAHGAYALFETQAGLILLDRRAAHERIWFERLQHQFRSGSVPSQRLLLAVPVELDPIASALLLDRLTFLNAHGFEISEFGRNFFRVEAMPAWMEPADAEPFLRDLLGGLREGLLPDKNMDVAREQLARLAAAKAIRLPSQVSEAEIMGVLTHLFATRAPLTSPSGKPTYIELNHGELARRFQK